MPPQRLITLTRGIQIRGQPIKNYNFFFKFKKKIRNFEIFLYIQCGLVSADATM